MMWVCPRCGSTDLFHYPCPAAGVNVDAPSNDGGRRMDDNAMKTAEERFEAWFNRPHAPTRDTGENIFKIAMREGYLAADAEAIKRTAQRCVEICANMKFADDATGPHKADGSNACMRAIAKEFFKERT